MPRLRSKTKSIVDLSRIQPQACSWQGCGLDGLYPAPKAKTDKDDIKPEMIYFCLGHVREYNLSWDFFSGMSQREIEEFQKEAMTGHRPTKKIRPNAKPKFRSQPLFNIDEIFDFAVQEKKAAMRQLPPAEKEALAVLDLDYKVTLFDVRERYKILVKKHHPDINGGDKESEEKFKNINQAYNFLKNSNYFA